MSEMVKGSDQEVLHINSLPEEILIKIFSYLTQNELGLIARVSQRWKDLTRSPVLWKIVDVYFSHHHKSQNDVLRKFIACLPLCTSHIKLDFMSCPRLSYDDFAFNLQSVCPKLEVLILCSVYLTSSFSLVIHLCSKFLPNIRILCFDCCEFEDCSCCDFDVKRNLDNISKIEVLSIRGCGVLNKPPFSKMPYLKELHTTDADNSWFEGDVSFLSNLEMLNLSYSWVSPIAFQNIRNAAFNLIELYLCRADVTDNDFNFNNSIDVLPHLKIICVFGSLVTMEGVVSLLRSCLSVQKIYLRDDIWKDESYDAQPFAKNRELEIIKIEFMDDCQHDACRDYLHE